MRLSFAAVLPAVLLSAALATPVAAAELQIGVIYEAILLRDSPQLKAAQDKIKAEFQKREDDLKADMRKLGDDVKKYQRDGDTMSVQQRADTEKSLNTRRIDLELKQRQFTEEVQNRNAELQRDLVAQINWAIRDVASAKSLDLVVRDPAFAGAALDITADVVHKLSSPKPAASPEPKRKK
ncbi:MAG: OmpH family outer membrane protein [Gammaproteobacteria bacterium]